MRSFGSEQQKSRERDRKQASLKLNGRICRLLDGCQLQSFSITARMVVLDWQVTPSDATPDPHTGHCVRGFVPANPPHTHSKIPFKDITAASAEMFTVQLSPCKHDIPARANTRDSASQQHTTLCHRLCGRGGVAHQEGGRWRLRAVPLPVRPSWLPQLNCRLPAPRTGRCGGSCTCLVSGGPTGCCPGQVADGRLHSPHQRPGLR